MNDPLNIVAVPRRFVREDWGGVETYVLETGQRIRAAGHHIEIVCPSILTDRREETVGGLPVTRTPYFYPYLGLSQIDRDKLDKVGGNPFSFSLIRALSRMPSMDIIHAHTGKRVGGIARHVARRRRVPYVITLHGGVFDLPIDEEQGLMAPATHAVDLGKALGWWVGSRRVMDDASAIICISKREQREIQARLPDNRVEYLPNGADVDRFSRGDGMRFRNAYGIPESARLLVTVARIAPQKNQILLAKELPELRRIDSNIHVALVGSVNDTAYHDEIVQTAREAGVADALTIVPGLQPEDPLLVDAFHSADVFVLPSIHEPFGIVVLEAWAAGRPVLAARVGGVPDFLEDGVTGLLFDPRDEADFIRTYKSLTPERARAISEAALGKAPEYRWDTITDRLVDTYRTVIREYADRQRR